MEERQDLISREVMKKLGKSDEISACCRCLSERRTDGLGDS